MVDATSAVLLLRDDPRQSCAASAPAFPDTSAQGSSTFESSTRSLAQSAEALRVLASAATTAEEGVKGTSPAESAQALGTGTFRSKRPLLELDASGGSKGHDSENSPSPKRPRRSSFDSRYSPRLESDSTCSTPTYSYANTSVSPPGQVPEEAGLQLPRTPASRAVSSSTPTGDGISLADIKQLLEDQTKQLLESLTRQLLDSQTKQISLLAAEVESLKRKVHSSSQVEEWDIKGNDDSDGDGDGDSTGLKSAKRRKWIPSDEALLERLKLVQSNNNGMPSDHVIAEKLNRSVDAVKQHWSIMQKTGRQNGKGHNKKVRRNKRKARSSR
ncbi:hypothetical protein NW767_015604 [Fusarium falciforme]|nr:hypothetical protein NW767_015604 [Fusarium falciforme]